MTWNPFKKDKAQEPIEEESPAKTVGKGRPTPKMKQAQARNLRPLVPPDRKASAKAAKARLREKENAEYERCRRAISTTCPSGTPRLGVSTSVIMWMPFQLGEWFIVAFSFVLLHVRHSCLCRTSGFHHHDGAYVRLPDCRDHRRMADVAQAQGQAHRQYGERSVSKGSRSFSYAWSRSIQMRRWRLPKPRYPKRGHWPAD
mgnify:CR=1 FL=1